MSFLLAILINLCLYASAWCLGQLTLSQFSLKLNSFETLALSTLLGLGFLGSAGFLVGLAFFNLWSISALLLLPIALYFVFLKGSLQKTFLELKNSVKGIEIYLFFSIAVVLCFSVIGLIPAIGGYGHDAIAYHYFGPAKWLMAGKIYPVHENIQTAFPAIVETLFGFTMAFSRESGPGFFGPIWALILGFQILGFLECQNADSPTKGVLLLLLVSSPLVMRHANQGFIDLPFTCFSFASLQLLFHWNDKKSLLMSFLFLGFSFSVKYTALFIAVSNALILTLASLWKIQNLNWKDLSKGMGLTTLICLPWYLKNLIVYGCPMVPAPPFFYRFFEISYYDLEASQKMVAHMKERGQGLGRGLLDYFLLPIRFSLVPEYFHGAGGFSIAPLAYIPTTLKNFLKNPNEKLLSTWTLSFFTIWFFTAQEARYFFPAAPPLLILSVLVWRTWQKDTSKLRGTLLSLPIAISLVYGLLFLARWDLPKLKSLASPSYFEMRKEIEIPAYQAIVFINQRPEIKKLLILNPNEASFYIKKPSLKWKGARGASYPPFGNITALLPLLLKAKELEFTHVLDTNHSTYLFQLEPALFRSTLFESNTARIFDLNELIGNKTI